MLHHGLKISEPRDWTVEPGTMSETNMFLRYYFMRRNILATLWEDRVHILPCGRYADGAMLHFSSHNPSLSLSSSLSPPHPSPLLSSLLLVSFARLFYSLLLLSSPVHLLSLVPSSPFLSSLVHLSSLVPSSLLLSFPLPFTSPP